MRITSRQLRQIIREELVREAEQNPGSAAINLKLTAIKKRITDELSKTNEWFKNVVFPAIENNDWPVIADQDYLVNVAIDSTENLSDVFLKYKINDFDVHIKKGTTYKSIDDEQPVRYGAQVDGPGRRSLLNLYGILEYIVVDLKLNVPMESFPDTDDSNT